MYKTIFISAFCVVAISSEPPAVHYGVPSYTEAQQYQPASHQHTTQQYHKGYSQNQDETPKPYEFQYKVEDAHSGNNYGHQEKSDGNQVQGEYRVALPDSRTQIVSYWADKNSGYHSDVRYEGEAKFPQASNAGYSSGAHAQHADEAVNAGYDYSQGAAWAAEEQGSSSGSY